MTKKRKTTRKRAPKKVIDTSVNITGTFDGPPEEVVDAITRANTGVNGRPLPPGTYNLPKEEEEPLKTKLTKREEGILAKIETLLQEYNENGPQPVFNRYVCRACGNLTITKDVDPGTSPFMIGCTKPSCTGDALSGFYQTGQDRDKWDFEWYRPEDILAYLRDNPKDEDHIVNGGLILREVES